MTACHWEESYEGWIPTALLVIMVKLTYMKSRCFICCFLRTIRGQVGSFFTAGKIVPDIHGFF